MSVSIQIPDELTRYSGGQKSIDVEASTVGEALQCLFSHFPTLQKRLVDENRHFYPYVPAFLNDEKLALRGVTNKPLNEGDQLTFMVIASGG